MNVVIRPEPGYLKMEVEGRETPGEGRAVSQAFLDALHKHAVRKALILVRGSRPIFRLEKYDFAATMDILAKGFPRLQVALVADTPELHASHEYIELLARQKGVNLRAFRDEHTGLAWLRGSAVAP